MNKLEIEKLTKKILDAEKIFNPPVDVELIADISYDLEIDLRKLTLDNSLAAIDFKRKKIILNELYEKNFIQNVGLKNFTIAHELGHWFLHKNLPREKNLFGEDFICTVKISDSQIERQANYFAACLLMPEKFVRADFEKFQNSRLLGNRRLLKFVVESMAYNYNVSKQAMTIRLANELKLIYIDNNKDYFFSKLEAMEESGQGKLF